jgi:hypothetical protein
VSYIYFQIRQVFLNELELSVERLLSVLEPLQRILHEEYSLVRTADTDTDTDADIDTDAVVASTSTTQEKHVRSSLQTLLLAIADLGRLQLLYSRPRPADSPSDRGPESEAPVSGDYLRGLKEQQVRVYRQRAVRVAPHNGAPFEALSRLAVSAEGAEAGPGSSRGGGEGEGKGKGKGRQRKDVFLSAYYLARGMATEV